MLETVNYESHSQMTELATFLNAEASEDLTYDHVPSSALQKVISYLVLADDADDAAVDGTSLTDPFLQPGVGGWRGVRATHIDATSQQQNSCTN